METLWCLGFFALLALCDKSTISSKMRVPNEIKNKKSTIGQITVRVT